MDIYYDPYKVRQYGWSIRERDVEKFRSASYLYVVVAIMYDGFEHVAMDITAYEAICKHGELMESGHYERANYYRVAVRYKKHLYGRKEVIGPLD